MTILRDATAINDGTTAIMAVSLRNHGDNCGATAVYAVQTAVVPRLRCDGGISGLSIYSKQFLLNKYESNCQIINCYICN